MRREWIDDYESGEMWSPSMRREWIEIPKFTAFRPMPEVSLHAEGVD